MAKDRRERAVTSSARADYLRGAPAADGPITRGRLELTPGGLRFSAPDGPELRIDLADMEGLTVSGRSPYERPRRAVRGTMLVATRRNGSLDVWEFAVARNAGAVLRDRIHRELHARRLRRPPLPFVEQLVGPVLAQGEVRRATASNGSSVAPGEGKSADGAHGDQRGVDPGGLSLPVKRTLNLRRPRVAIVAVVAFAVILAEVLVPLLVLR